MGRRTSRAGTARQNFTANWQNDMMWWFVSICTFRNGIIMCTSPLQIRTQTDPCRSGAWWKRQTGIYAYDPPHENVKRVVHQPGSLVFKQNTLNNNLLFPSRVKNFKFVKQTRVRAEITSIFNSVMKFRLFQNVLLAAVYNLTYQSRR